MSLGQCRFSTSASYTELRPALDQAYRRVMESGTYVLGDEVVAFEREFAKYWVPSTAWRSPAGSTR